MLEFNNIIYPEDKRTLSISFFNGLDLNEILSDDIILKLIKNLLKIDKNDQLYIVGHLINMYTGESTIKDKNIFRLLINKDINYIVSILNDIENCYTDKIKEHEITNSIKIIYNPEQNDPKIFYLPDGTETDINIWEDSYYNNSKIL